MNLLKKIVLAVSIASALVSCDMFDKKSGLSNDEIVQGLKTALNVGTDSSVAITSKVNGYLKDEAIKILLPKEANIITDNIQYAGKVLEYATIVNNTAKLVGLTAVSTSSIETLNLSSLVDKTVISLNRAAEEAAKSAAPIFKNSISSLSITQGLTILNGTNPVKDSARGEVAGFDSLAATYYLHATTRQPLINAYKTPVNTVLDKDLGLGFSANVAWSNLSDGYKKVADVATQIINLENEIKNNDIYKFSPVKPQLLSADQHNTLAKFTPMQNVSLAEYVTGKALDGLFVKVGDQEKSIRKNPFKWLDDTVGAILRKVFGKK
jgi:hypothetical protein